MQNIENLVEICQNSVFCSKSATFEKQALPECPTKICHLLSTKTISNIKKVTSNATTMMDWLKKNNVYVKVNLLSHKTIHTLGYLFLLHPNMTYHVSLKGILHKAITDIKISKEERKEKHLAIKELSR